MIIIITENIGYWRYKNIEDISAWPFSLKWSFSRHRHLGTLLCLGRNPDIANI